ncbi:MAG: hypothetical protein P8P30_00720 [Rickettsiales bacterium]|nr:hypothetical protein [Rickettsiales bacterium]
MVLFAGLTTASAQVNTTQADLLNSIGKGGSATGSGAGKNLLDTYKNQLKQGMACTNGNTIGCKALPNRSGSTSSSPTAPPTKSNPPPATPRTNSSPSMRPPATPRTNPNPPTTPPKTPPLTGLTRDKLVDEMGKAVAKRINNLGSNLPTADLAGIIRYIEAMNTILRLSEAPADKPAITAVLNKLAQSNTAPIMANLEVMQKSERELSVLQVARRVEGTEVMTKVINDFGKNGGRKMKKAMYKMDEKLRSVHASASLKEKNKIRKVMNLLNEHSRKDIPNQVMKAALNPLMMKGKLLPGFDGQMIAQLLESTDYNYDEEDDDDDLPGADVIKRASQVK